LYQSSSGELRVVTKFDSLQALRGVAALLVVFFHTQTILTSRCAFDPFAGIFSQGDKGVDLFFVLSGFIIAHVHSGDIGRSRRLGSYIYNRVCRIYPAVWIMSAAALAIYALGFDASKATKLRFPGVIASFFLLPQAGDALVNVTWTLKYEVFFYALFGLMIVQRMLGVVVLAAWQSAILVIALIGVDTSASWAFYVRPIALEFGMGVLVAALVRRIPATGTWAGLLGYMTLGIGFVGFVATALLQTYASPKFVLPRFATYGLAAALIILGCCVLDGRSRLNVPRLMVVLGNASYSIYIVHFSVITGIIFSLVKCGLCPSDSLTSLVVATLGIGAGWLFHYMVDAPIVRYLAEARRAGVWPVLHSPSKR
jgi:peptidoglycan/LPS O-acetylase OafA/YrhL